MLAAHAKDGPIVGAPEGAEIETHDLPVDLRDLRLTADRFGSAGLSNEGLSIEDGDDYRVKDNVGRVITSHDIISDRLKHASQEQRDAFDRMAASLVVETEDSAVHAYLPDGSVDASFVLEGNKYGVGDQYVLTQLGADGGEYDAAYGSSAQVDGDLTEEEKMEAGIVYNVQYKMLDALGIPSGIEDVVDEGTEDAGEAEEDEEPSEENDEEEIPE